MLLEHKKFFSKKYLFFHFFNETQLTLFTYDKYCCNSSNDIHLIGRYFVKIGEISIYFEVFLVKVVV